MGPDPIKLLNQYLTNSPMKQFSIFFFIAAFALTTGCLQSPEKPEKEETVPPVPDGPPPRFAITEADYLFDSDTLHTIELSIHPDSLAKIDADPAAVAAASSKIAS